MGAGPKKAELKNAPKGSMSTSTKTRHWDAGKGSKSRVRDLDKYEENWEKIFSKKKKEDEEKDK